MKKLIQVFIALGLVLTLIALASSLNFDNSIAQSSSPDTPYTETQQDTSPIKASLGGYTLYLPIIMRPPPPIFIPFVVSAIPTPTPSPTPIPNPVQNGGFEQANSSNGPWFASLTYSGQPANGIDVRTNETELKKVGVSAPHAGSYAAWLGGYPGGQTDMMQYITIPANGSTLRYWTWVQSAEPLCDANNYDGVWIFFITSKQNQLETYPLCTASVTSGWVKRDINLASYVGQSGWLAFSVRILGANSNLFIDDVQIGNFAPVPDQKIHAPTLPFLKP